MVQHFEFSLEEMRHKLHTTADMRYCKITLFAEAAGFSPATLNHYLHGKGTSWTIELNAERQKRLDKYLALVPPTEWSASIISGLLGFSDVTSFYFWFKRSQKRNWSTAKAG